MLVQFGNNWIQKIPQIPNWTAYSPITYTNEAIYWPSDHFLPPLGNGTRNICINKMAY